MVHAGIFRWLLLFLLSSIHLCAQQAAKLPKQEQIHSLIRFYAEEKKFNGNVLIAEYGEIIYENAIGWADIKNNEGLTLSTPFYLASISKSFTALCVMMLKEEGKLDYNDKIYMYFPELGAPAKKISIRNLLQHTSGLPDYIKMGWDEPGLTNAQLYGKLINNVNQLKFKPGYKFRYNNTGYVLLALIVEKASGVPFYAFVKNRICKPLGMKNTWVYDLRVPERNKPGRAIGYRSNLKKTDDYYLLTWGDGGIYSSIEDLFILDRALYSEKLVSAKTLEEAYTPVALVNGATKNYGFGWVIGNNLNGKTVSHTGGLAGFRNYFERQIDVENTIIILTNTNNNYITEMRNILVKILDGRSYVFPEN
ncbi:MAG: beta-lactamase family protein [Bacteroidetes bacterium]|nr:beta-lactamase family protein [Bacteroidota bacterium]